VNFETAAGRDDYNGQSYFFCSHHGLAKFKEQPEKFLRAAPHGYAHTAHVLIKNAEALEVLEKIDTLVVDKTGTLTEGKPHLSALVPAAGQNENEILHLAEAIRMLHDDGVKLVMLTGDNRTTAEAVAKRLGAVTQAGGRSQVRGGIAIAEIRSGP
jgi:magnesium-transporting ATPase (P-type)/YHS domain-containing protein